jgi:hypothetical protein
MDPDRIGYELNWVPGTGSRRTKMTQKIEKLINFIFEVQDVL